MRDHADTVTVATPGQGATPAQQFGDPPPGVYFGTRRTDAVAHLRSEFSWVASAGGSGMAEIFGERWLPEDRRAQHCTTHHNACDCREAAKDAEIAALRARLADAEHARDVAVATLSEQLDAANARVATLEAAAEALEQRTYGWIVGDPEGVYADFDECLSNFDYDPDDGAIIEWEVATVLRTERYRIVHERDEEGDIIRTKAELVTDAATGPIGGVA